MIGISSAKEASATLRRFDKHTVAARVRCAIGYAMQDDVNVDPGTKRLVQAFAPRTVNDFFNRKVGSCRLLAMKQGRESKLIIGDLQLGESLALH
jgi:hypothetical protein